MDNDVKNFIKNNKLRIKYHNSKKKILIADRSIPEHIIVHSLAGYILNEHLNYDVEIISSLSKENPLIKIYKSFNIDKFYTVQLKIKFINFGIFLKTILIFLLTIFKIKTLGELWFIKQFSIKKIYIGDLVYDHYIRNDLSFLNKNFFDKKFLKLLFISIYNFYFIENLFKKNRYETVISGTNTYVSVSAITMRIALKRGIKVANIISNNLRFFTNYKESLRSELYINKNTLKSISKQKNWKKKFLIYFNNRIKGKIIYPTAKDAYLNKKNFRKSELLKKFSQNKKNFKRLGIFAPHSFSDTNHGSGKFIFRDYFRHFVKTLKIIDKDKKTLWLVKPHPSRHFYNEVGIIEREIKKLNSKNVFLCPINITPKSAILASDVFVSGRGSIGLEAACFGKKTILAGECFYSHLGLTYNPKNVKEYVKLITGNLNNKLDYKKTNLAKMAFYFQAFKNSTVKSKLFPITNYININTLNNSIYQQKIKVKDYLCNLNKKLKYNSIKHDELYKNFKIKIMNEFKKN
jgi:hypothetical protein